MEFYIYNTKTRKKEKFISKHKIIRFYGCGPTVYNYAHIGNLRTYIFQDVLFRFLKYIGYDVFYFQCLTDIDDKTIRDSQKNNISLKEFTQKYTEAYMENLNQLNILFPNKFVKATEVMDKMIEQTQSLLDIGYAYLAEDNSIYYDISKFKDYGKFAKLDMKNLKANARVDNDEYEKDDLADFVLWKSWTKKDGDVYYDAKFIIDGKEVIIRGRPGWHSECSAIISREFNDDSIDIHSGGIDLIFPHHQNEIAIFEGINKKEFSSFWVHAEHLLVDNKKMSKSLGNFYTLPDIEKMGYDALHFRMLVLSAHYSQKLNFTMDSLIQAKNTLNNINDFIASLYDIKNDGNLQNHIKIETDKTKEYFIKGLLDDINLPKAWSYVFDFMKYVNKENLNINDSQYILDFFKSINNILGVFDFEKKEIHIPEEIISLADKRLNYKKDKNFNLADKIRLQIEAKGYKILDEKEGYKILKLK